MASSGFGHDRTSECVGRCRCSGRKPVYRTNQCRFETFNADEAIELLTSRSDIQVVITDVNMPGPMDGLELAHAVRNRWPPIGC